MLSLLRMLTDDELLEDLVWSGGEHAVLFSPTAAHFPLSKAYSGLSLASWEQRRLV